MVPKMPQVVGCSVEECAYNANKNCHAMAITVGDPHGSADCDTYFKSENHGGVKDLTAGVGACKLAMCQFNKDYECTTTGINIGMSQANAGCLSFQMR